MIFSENRYPLFGIMLQSQGAQRSGSARVPTYQHPAKGVHRAGRLCPGRRQCPDGKPML